MHWYIMVPSFFGGMALAYLFSGMFKVWLYNEEIKAAFRRDPKPFKPNQLWLVRIIMGLTWPYIDWEGEVLYYENGLPGYRTGRSETQSRGDAGPTGISSL